MKCLLSPDSAGYVASPGSPVISTALDGGSSRFRADKIGVPAIVNVQWSASRKNFNYLMAFFRTATKEGALSFTIDLVIDGDALHTYTCHFVKDTFQLASQSGNTYVVTASLEVVPLAIDAVADNVILAAGPE